MGEWQQWLKPHKSVDVAFFLKMGHLLVYNLKLSLIKTDQTRCKLAYSLMSQVQFNELRY